MKIVHTSDWHLGKSLNDYSLLEDQRFFLRQFVREMEEIRPHVILIAGDIYDRSVPPAEAVTLFHEVLTELVERLKIPVIATAGNHDSGQRLSFAGSLLAKSRLYLLGKTEASPAPILLEDEYGEVSFYPLPYCDLYDLKPLFPEDSPKSDRDAFELYARQLCKEVDFSRRNVLSAHGFFTLSGSLTQSDGTTVGGSETLSLSPLAQFDYIALGHIHSQRVAGLPNARYSGSPLKYSVDEANQKKGYLLVELGRKGELSVTSRPITPLRDLRVLTGSFSELMNAPAEAPDDYVFVSLTDKQPVLDAASRLKGIYKNLLGIQFPNYESQFLSPTRRGESIRKATLPELFREFFTASTGEELCEEQQEMIEKIAKSLGGDRR